MNEKLDQLIEQLAGAVAAIWGSNAKAMLSIHPDGYRSISVEEWDEDKSATSENWKRRTLYDSYHFTGESWDDDRSADQNKYYQEKGCLLEREG